MVALASFGGFHEAVAARAIDWLTPVRCYGDWLAATTRA